MHIDFPLGKKRTQLGVISDPVVPISVLTRYGYQEFDFLVDTGADCSIMPAAVAKDIGIELSRLPKIHFCGIEGGNVTAYISRITIKINGVITKITCALSSNEKTPFILGRKDVFSKFNIAFNNKNKLITFITF